MKKTPLEVRVMALNLLNEYAEKIVKTEQEYFKQFLGKDIFKVDGNVKQKFLPNPEFQHRFEFKTKDGSNVKIFYYRELEYSSRFVLNIRVTVSGGSFDDKSHYHENLEIAPKIFSVVNGVLVEDTSPSIEKFSERFDVRKITAEAQKVEKIAEEYRQAYLKFPHQFRDLFYLKSP